MGRSRDTHLPEETAFGGLDGDRRSGVPLSLPVQKAQALFAYAALKSDQLHARAKIMTLRWRDQEERLAGQNLRRALYLIGSVTAQTVSGVAAPEAAPSAGAQLDILEKRLFRRGAPPRMKHGAGEAFDAVSVQ
jgi:DNA-binding SARP family transcriptional activator